MESRSLMDRCSRILLFASLFIPLGCAQRHRDAFNRFWGCGGTESCAVQQNTGIGGIVPALVGLGADTSEDPFLAENLAAADGHPESWQSAEVGSQDQVALNQATDVVPLFDHPPVNADEQKSQAQPATGNPFRLVQHHPPVNEISSEEDPFLNSGDNPKPPPPGPPVAGGSQIDRLKVALSRDANTPRPANPPREGAEVARQRVESMMKNARRQMRLGEDASALRWAMAAEQLAERSELFFGPEEDPPADLVRMLQDRLQIPSQPLDPSAEAIVETPVPDPVPAPAAPPELNVEISAKGRTESSLPPPAEIQPGVPTQLHSTGAMQKAAIASDSKAPPTLKPQHTQSPLIAPGQKHPRSLKVDARRVNANQGATVSVEGQLNPPPASSLPKLEWAPPATEKQEPPPFELAMIEPAHPSTDTPPPLPRRPTRSHRRRRLRLPSRTIPLCLRLSPSRTCSGMKWKGRSRTDKPPGGCSPWLEQSVCCYLCCCC